MPFRNTPRTILAGLSVLAITMSGALTINTSALAADTLPVQATSPPDIAMQIQTSFVEQNITGFADAQVDGTSIVVEATEAGLPIVRLLAQQINTPHYQLLFKSVPSSYQTLEAQAEAISSQSDMLVTEGIRLGSISLDPSSGHVDISILPPTPELLANANHYLQSTGGLAAIGVLPGLTININGQQTITDSNYQAYSTQRLRTLFTANQAIVMPNYSEQFFGAGTPGSANTVTASASKATRSSGGQPPWNGGNVITGGSNRATCTSGFFARDENTPPTGRGKITLDLYSHASRPEGIFGRPVRRAGRSGVDYRQRT